MTLGYPTSVVVYGSKGHRVTKCKNIEGDRVADVHEFAPIECPLSSCNSRQSKNWKALVELKPLPRNVSVPMVAVSF